MVQELTAGDRVKFDHERRSWLVRGVTPDGRYALVTSPHGETVMYTVIDREESIRGPLNVIGGGVGIRTSKGPDQKVAAAIDMLLPKTPLPADGAVRPYERRGFTVSQHNRVDLMITEHRPNVEPVGEDGFA